MDLLPIIVVLSLLAFFIALMLVILAFQYSRSRARRKAKQNRQSTESAQQPTRHMTVRNGRVVRLSDCFKNRDSGAFNSPGLSSPKLDGSIHSSNEKDLHGTKDLQYPAPLWLAGQRISAVSMDIEAQQYRNEREQLSEKVFRTLGESRIHSPRSSPGAPRAKGSNNKRQTSITNSLLKAYKGPAIPGTEPVELPASPHSQPIVVRKLSQKPAGDNGETKTTPLRPLTYRSKSAGRARTLVPKTVTFESPDNRRHSEGARKTSLPEAVELPTPRFIGERHSLRRSIEEHEYHHPVSFFSNSPSSSMDSHPDSPLIVPPLTLRPKKTLPPPRTGDRNKGYWSTPTASPPRRRSRPPDINTNIPVPNIRDSSFIDSSSSTKTAKDMHRGPSVMSNRSDMTFASSEISTHWTFGNAKSVVIAPSVVPQTLSMPPVPRPRSKYRRKTKRSMNKSLPVLPKSPLSR